MAQQSRAFSGARSNRPAPSELPVPVGLLALAVFALASGWGLRPGEFHRADFWQSSVVGRLLVYLLSAVMLAQLLRAQRGRRFFIRRIAGLGAVDDTVGRATEMGRPIAFSLGIGSLDIETLQALAIGLHVTRMAIRYGTRVIVTVSDGSIYAIADEAMREAYATAGKPESYRMEDVRYLSDQQFAYATAAMGLILRERVASSYMFGFFAAEALILAEAGNLVGAVQVAGTPSITQIPFFIATCDYTIIGEEYYAATAYLTREPVLCGSLIGQDHAKQLVLGLIVVLTLLATIAPLVPGTHNLSPLTSVLEFITNSLTQAL
jgi:hypothetical protein